MLAEDGKLSLDDRITQHLSDLPTAWNAVTVRHLLSCLLYTSSELATRGRSQFDPMQRFEGSRLIVIAFTFNQLFGKLIKVGVLKKIVGIRNILGKT